MDNKKKEGNVYKKRESRFIINIYAVLAIVFVLIPEWIAELGITLQNDEFKDVIPKHKISLTQNSYFYIFSLNARELRVLASKLRIHGYSNENKRTIRERIVLVLKKKNSIKW